MAFMVQCDHDGTYPRRAHAEADAAKHRYETGHMNVHVVAVRDESDEWSEMTGSASASRSG